jgi:hypothetical protein
MKNIKFLIPIFSLSVLFCLAFTACEIDNYDAPDCTIEGTIFDHHNNPYQLNHGSELLRIRELSWAQDDETYIANRRLKVQQDGTYRNTKIFKGTYRLLPYEGAFFPYDDVNRDNDDAGDLVEIKGTVKKDFVITPFLTVEWVKKPYVDADTFLICSVKFTRNQKSGYNMPNLQRANLQVSRTVNAGAADGSLFTTQPNITNDMEGQEITFKTVRKLKYTGIDYWVRVRIDCQSVGGDPTTNYQGVGSGNFTTIEKIFVK